MSDANIWQGPNVSTPVVNADGNIFEETQLALLNQTVFTLATFTYTPNTHSIFVFKNGTMLRRGVDYAETSSTQITLAAGAALNDKLTFVAYAIQQIIPPIVYNGMPAGGTDGQLLTKVGSSDYNVQWSNPSSVTTLLDAARVNVASASTINLSAIAATTRNVQITGSVQIDGFQVANGEVWAVKFAASLTLSNNANINTNTGSAIAVVAGASCLIRATADNVVEVLSYSAFNAPAGVASLNGGQLAGFRSKVINGSFGINQDGLASPQTLAAGTYGHDMWKAGAGGCTYSWATVGNDTVITITAGSLIQIIEGSEIEGGVYTLSHQGTAQARTAVNGAATAGAYAACPQQTAAATANQNVTIEFTTGTVDKVQLELGTQATPYERKFKPIQEMLCKRYYQVINYISSFIATGGSQDVYQSINLPVSMRAVPAFVKFAGTFTNSSDPAAPTITTTNYTAFIRSAAAGTVYGGYSIRLSARL